jgi:pilus assembly protein CpaE
VQVGGRVRTYVPDQHRLQKIDAKPPVQAGRKFMSLTFLLLSKNSESSNELRLALSSGTNTRLLGECDSAQRLLADITLLRPSAAIVVLSQDDPDREFALIKELIASSPDTAIITASRDTSSALILRSMRSGAHEFLQLPIVADEFRTVVDRIGELRLAGEGASRKHGHVVAVFSGKGGSGVSFFATNLAAAMNVPTLLADLNLQAGDAASFLGIDAKYSVADFVHNRARLDDALISSFITVHSSRLSLLAAPFEAHEAEDIKPQDITEILHLLRQRFECIVLDLPHTFDPATVAALDLADDIVVVLTLDIPGIRSTNRAIKVFNRLGYARTKVHVVVNRWSKNIDVQLEKVEAHLDEQMIGLVPNDYRKVMESINLGQPLMESDPSSKITVEIKRIATLVSGGGNTSSTQARRGLFRGMFGRQNPTGSLHLTPMMKA